MLFSIRSKVKFQYITFYSFFKLKYFSFRQSPDLNFRINYFHCIKSSTISPPFLQTTLSYHTKSFPSLLSISISFKLSHFSLCSPGPSLHISLNLFIFLLFLSPRPLHITLNLLIIFRLFSYLCSSTISLFHLSCLSLHISLKPFIPFHLFGFLHSHIPSLETNPQLAVIRRPLRHSGQGLTRQ